MKKTPNPQGKEGKPFSLAPLTFDEAVGKMLATPPPERQYKPQAKPTKASKKTSPKR